jgi:nitroreductase
LADRFIPLGRLPHGTIQPGLQQLKDHVMAAPIANYYDVFISCSEEDQEWVDAWLLPRLEEAKLRVIVGYRDFELGTPTLINIERAIERSRRTIVVLTPAWLASEWNSFESLLVQASDPAARRRKLLPLLLKPCDLPKRIASLQAADFRVDRFWERQSRRLVRDISDIIPVEPPWQEPGGIRQLARWKRWLWRYRREIRRSVLAVVTLLLLLAMLLQLPPFFDLREGWRDIGLDTQGATSGRLARAGDVLLVGTDTDSTQGCASPDTGLWRRAAAGEPWVLLAPPLEFTTAKGCQRAAIMAFAVDRAAPQTIFAATSDRSVLRGDHGGAQWSPVTSTGLPSQTLAIAVTPAFPGTLFVSGLSAGVYRLRAGASAWERLDGAQFCAEPNSANLPASLKIRALLGVDRALYLGTDQPIGLRPGPDDGVYASYDGGNCWKRLDSASGRYQYKALAWVPGHEEELLALTYDTLAASKGEAKFHLWRLSAARGRTASIWDSLYTVQAIYVAPGQPAIWYAATNLGQVYRGDLDSPSASAVALHPLAFNLRCFLNKCQAALAPDADPSTPLLLMESHVYRWASVPWYRRIWP